MDFDNVDHLLVQRFFSRPLLLFTTATFPLFYLPTIILLEVQLFFSLNSALRKSFSSCNIKQSENRRGRKISTTYGRQNNLPGIVLTYRRHCHLA